MSVNRPLLQLVGIMDALLGTAALFYIFYRHGILTLATKAFSYILPDEF